MSANFVYKMIVGRSWYKLVKRSIRWSRLSQTCNFANMGSDHVMNVFDRNAKRMQRDRSAMAEDYHVYEYLKEEVGWRVADRICDVKRKFNVAVDIGCGRGYVSRHVYSDMVGTFYQMEMSEELLKQATKSSEVPTHNIVADEEFIPFKPNSLDLVTSSLSLHWVNDLPGTFKQIQQALRNDGCLLGSMFGGDTLYELRSSLQLAETEREGGFGLHVSPFTSIQDLGNLLNRAGFVMLTIDVDEIVIRYPSMFELMWDLKGMAENNCVWSRRTYLPRETQIAASAIYQEMYGKEGDRGVPATFQIINFIGWKPDPSQQTPAKRGSGQMSLKDIDKVNQLVDQFQKTKGDTKQSGSNLKNINNKLNDIKTNLKDPSDKQK